jgi:hypothetical protein
MNGAGGAAGSVAGMHVLKMAVSFVALMGRHLQMTARSQSETRHFTLDKG